jgi:hypothetical protein
MYLSMAWQNKHRVKFLISKIPLIGLVTRLGWRYGAEIASGKSNLNEIKGKA